MRPGPNWVQFAYIGPKKGGFHLGGRATGHVYCVNPGKKTMPVHPKDVAQFEALSSEFRRVW